MMRRLFVGLWVLTLSYVAARLTVLAPPNYCPDKIWESGPPECDWTPLDIAVFVGLPFLFAGTVLALVVALPLRVVRKRRRLSL